MTAKEFNQALGKIGLSVYASAKALGISLRQAQRNSDFSIEGLPPAYLALTRAA